MNMQRGFLCGAFAAAVVAGAGAHGFGAQHASEGAARSPDVSYAKSMVLLVALTEEQRTACERERQALEARRSQCTTEECRQSVQAEIDAHNARCQ
jgi:hypothetical protein